MWCIVVGMTRTNIDIDDALINRAMRLHHLSTKREAVHLALMRLVGSAPMSIDEQLSMRGTGWEGDLDGLRNDRNPGWNA